jgi:parallel beta-helix repeat protein
VPSRRHNVFGLPLLLALCALVLAACGGATAPSVSDQSTATGGGERQRLRVETLPPAVAAMEARQDLCMTPAPTIGVSSDQPARGVSYDAERRTIVLSEAEPTSLAAVGAALGRPDLLGEVQPGEWLLSANLEIRDGAALTIAGPEISWLKLRSDSQGFAAIKARGGRLVISDTCLSSWDPAQNGVDENVADGRSFVLARDGAWMAVYRSHLHHLGYEANESYGIAWRLEGTGGEIVDSELAYNFYGLYTYQVQGLIIRGNEVHHSLRYGIDPHTASSGLLIEGNVAHHNGKHGIILAEGCSDSIIRNNTVYNNTLHGIVLYNGSNNNRVEGNTAFGNGEQGINLNNVADSRVEGNTVYGNVGDGIGVGQGARGNAVIGNIVSENQEHGIHLYSGAEGTSIEGNEVSANRRYGIYVKSSGNQIGAGNRVVENAVGVHARAEDVPQSVRTANVIDANLEADVRIAEE